MADTDYAVRHCNGCGENKPLTKDFFYPDKAKKTGFRFRCIGCTREEAKQRQRKRLADPDVYAATLEKNKVRAASKRGPRKPLPEAATCCKCGNAYPRSTEFFGARKEGRAKLKSRCRSCEAQLARDLRKVPEYRARQIAYATAYQKRRLAIDPEYRERVRERVRKADRRRRADPILGEKARATDRAWYRANPEKVRAKNQKNKARLSFYQARRNAAKLMATPPWSERQKIEDLYEECRRRTLETGTKHNVDHIVPLRGKNVCGLHVFANLRVVTEFENKSKSNRLIEALAA